MASPVLRGESSQIQIYLITLGSLVASLALFYVWGVLYRRSSRPRQDGIDVIVEKQNAIIDIVAVHGLGAHPEYTWTTYEQVRRPDPGAANHTTNVRRVNWLKDDGFLQSDFDAARIMTFGYNADWFLGAPMATAEQRAQTLLRELKRKRAGIKESRPILFIGHSFGGIVLKHAICQAEVDSDFKSICNATSGIIFLGTPHQGSDASYPALILTLLTTPFFGSNALLLRLLRKHSTELSTLRQRFSHAISRMAEFHIPLQPESHNRLPLLYTFVETKETFLFRFIRVGQIVNFDSATTDLAKRTIEIDKDHSGLNKCYSRDDRLYLELCSVMREVLEALKSDLLMQKNRTKIFMTCAQKLKISELRALDANISDTFNNGKWYQRTEEYRKWEYEATSAFLWFKGRTRTGKTSEMASILRSVDESESELVDKIAYFFPKNVSNPARILRSLNIQIGRSNLSRVNILDDEQKSHLLSLLETEDFDDLDVLWGLFENLLQPCENRNLCLMLDGIDALQSEDLRGFAMNLHHIWRNIKLQPVRSCWFKILITSRPNVQLSEIFENEESVDPDTEVSDCLRSLALKAENPRQNDKNISEPTRRTGEWILEDGRYKAWFESDDSDILWIIGKPGSGKSTLLRRLLKESLRPLPMESLQDMVADYVDRGASLVDDHDQSRDLGTPVFQRNGSMVKGNIVASYFFNFRNKFEKDGGRMLQSILFQILKQEPRLFPLFRDKYLHQRRRHGGEASTPWAFDDLKQIFREIATFTGLKLRISLFLDAVDESEHSQAVMEILLQHLRGRLRPDITIKALVARRPMETVHEIPIDRIIELERHNADDIEKLVSEGLENIGRALDKFSDRIDLVGHLGQFKRNLKGRANGVILWVSIALTTVLNTTSRGNFTVAAMMKTLDALPSDLEELYAHIVSRLREQEDEDVERVKHMLRWTTSSGRMLSVSEFFHAVAVSEYPQAAVTGSPNLEDVMIQHTYLEGVRITLSSSCGGFLDVRAPQEEGELYDSTKFLIQLIHHSARTFLEKEQARPFQAVKAESNIKITQTCIHYLRLSLIRQYSMYDSDALVKHLGQHSLLAYIFSELPVHLLNLSKHDLLENLQELNSLLKELNGMNENHPGFLILYTWTMKLLAQMPSDQEEINAWRGKTKSTLFSWRRNTESVQSFFKEVIIVAIECHNFLALQVLCGADALSFDKDDEILSAALWTATNTNKPAILDFLFNQKAIPSQKKSKSLKSTYRDGLETACNDGYEVVARWWLIKDAISETNDQGRTAIHLAVKAGHDKVVKMLLEFDVNLYGEENFASGLLQVAAQRGYAEIVQLLLSLGISPNSTGDQHRTPLALALEQGHEAVVKLLLPLTTERPAAAKPISPSQFIVPKRRNSNFVGRDKVFEWLQNAFKSQITRLCLVGLSGSGKTQVAIEFAYRLKDQGSVPIILWMTAESDESFLKYHAYIGQRLQWQLTLNSSPEAQLIEFYNRLSLEPGPKFIIWDNVDFSTNMIRFASTLLETQDTYVLITSRNITVSQMFTREDEGMFKIGNFSASESIELLRKSGFADADENVLKAFADKVDHLPLAVHAVAMQIQQRGISPQDYQSILNNQQKRLRFSKNDERIIESAYTILLDDLEQHALNILYFISILDPDHIPESLLFSKSLSEQAHISMEEIEDSIATLKRFSLVQTSQDEAYLTLHRLVQEFAHTRLYKTGNLEVWENVALRTVSREFPKDTLDEPRTCRDLLPHALKVLECSIAKDDENFPYYFDLLRNVGNYTIEIGKYAVAEKLLQEACFASSLRHSEESSESQSATTLLARLYRYMGRLSESEIMEKSVMANLASTYRNQGRWDEAETLDRSATQGMSSVLGQEDPQTLVLMIELALVLRGQSRYDEAEGICQQTLALMNKVLGSEHPQTLSSMRYLGEILSDLGRNEEATQMQRQAFVSMGKVLGEEHPITWSAGMSLALLSNRIEREKTFKELFQKLR